MLADLNTASRIAERLRQQISSGERVPGTPLRQEALAKELGVSGMPVRDALQQLLAEGLVTLHPHRGMYISSLTAEECAELFDLRTTLESDALRRAMSKHTEASLRKLRFIQAELELPRTLARGLTVTVNSTSCSMLPALVRGHST